MLLSCVVLLAATAVGRTQDAAPPPIPLERTANVPGGRVGAIRGQVNTSALRFSLPDLSVLQPVEIVVRTAEPSKPIRIAITKFGFDGALREAESGTDGLASVSFRTQAGVGVAIEAVAESTTFELLAFVGDEREAVPRNVLTPMAKAGSAGWRLPVALTLGAAVVGAGALIVRSRRSR